MTVIVWWILGLAILTVAVNLCVAQMNDRTRKELRCIWDEMRRVKYGVGEDTGRYTGRYNKAAVRGFDENEINVIMSSGAHQTMSIDEAAALDDPEGTITVKVSATLFQRLVSHRDTARILASRDG